MRFALRASSVQANAYPIPSAVKHLIRRQPISYPRSIRPYRAHRCPNQVNLPRDIRILRQSENPRNIHLIQRRVAR